MEKKIFFAEEIEFKFPGKKIGEDEIEEIDDFPGKDDFIEFYITHNGGDFVNGAWFFPESCYSSSIYGKSYITLAMFLGIRVDDQERGLNIDVINNPFWIDIQTGVIKYIDFQVSTNPNDVVTVASSFKGFCMQIKKRTI
jgi:hypothetical protein